MNRFNLKSCRIPFRDFPQALRRAVAALHRDRSGATLTEFVIILPIFILIFNGVMLLGEFSRNGTEAPVTAYKKTFAKALAFQNSYFHLGTAGVNGHAISGALTAENQLGPGFLGEDTSPAHNDTGALKVATIAAEGVTYFELGRQGHMGESNARARTLGVIPGVKLIAADSIGSSWCTDCKQLNGSPSLLTADITKRVGTSKYAKSLFDDGASMPDFSAGGALPTVVALIDAAGVSPAIAAGIRYGTVSGQDRRTFQFAGRSMDFDAHFSTLVPPGTTGGSQGPRLDALRATAIARLSMEKEGHYSGLLGIEWSQRLPGGVKITVPAYP